MMSRDWSRTCTGEANRYNMCFVYRGFLVRLRCVIVQSCVVLLYV
jgi:hypothetical protein